MTNTGKPSKAAKGGLSALALAWLAVLASFGGVAGWLFATAEAPQTGVRVAGPPVVVLPLPLPPQMAATPAPAPAAEPEAPEVAAAPPAPEPEPPALEAPEPAPVAEAEEPVPPPAPAEMPQPKPSPPTVVEAEVGEPIEPPAEAPKAPEPAPAPAAEPEAPALEAPEVAAVPEVEEPVPPPEPTEEPEAREPVPVPAAEPEAREMAAAPPAAEPEPPALEVPEPTPVAEAEAAAPAPVPEPADVPEPKPTRPPAAEAEAAAPVEPPAEAPEVAAVPEAEAAEPAPAPAAEVAEPVPLPGLPEPIGVEAPGPAPGEPRAEAAPPETGPGAPEAPAAQEARPIKERFVGAVEPVVSALKGTGAAGAQVAALPPGGGLPPVPDPMLIERGRLGPLPVIGPDGREPWRVYARPFDQSDERPRIAVIIIGLGWSAAATETAIQQLPGEVTLAFSPYARDVEEWINLARAAGHETLLHLPMEPVNYPINDPGPYALLTSLEASQNLERLEWLLSRFTGYVGVTNHMGSRFTTSARDLKPILEALKSRGLMFVDARSSASSVATRVAKEVGLPRAYNNRFIDHEASREAIDKRLAEIERIARATGSAVAIGSPYPVTMERLTAWLPTLESKGFAVAPISALANRQDVK